MKRINVSFYDETYEVITQFAKKDGGHSAAHEIRELVDLGIKVKKARAENAGPVVDDATQKLLNLMKNNLVWSLETRLLLRHLVERLPGHESQQNLETISKCKEKAVHYVEGLLNNDE